jgi:hypothetical protein
MSHEARTDVQSVVITGTEGLLTVNLVGATSAGRSPGSSLASDENDEGVASEETRQRLDDLIHKIRGSIESMQQTSKDITRLQEKTRATLAELRANY